MKCLLVDWENLEKKIKKICRKLDKHNINYVFEKKEETIEIVNVHYKGDKCPQKVPMDVVNYNFSADILKLGDWRVVAVIEHNNTNNNNMVYMIDNTQPIQEDWTTKKGHCDHCNSNRQRNKTVILQDNSNNYKQVGTTCIKDFTGIDGNDIIKNYIEIQDIVIEEELTYTYDNNETINKYVDTCSFLAHCIDQIDANGYKKDTTKNNALTNYYDKHVSYSDTSLDMAKKVIGFFKPFDTLSKIQDEFGYKDASFCYNIATSLSSKYNTPNGFIAYAYMTYKKYTQQQQQDQNNVSQYQHNINDKVTLSLTLTRKLSFDGYYGVTHLYLFTDNNSNIYKWTTNKEIDIQVQDKLTISGTIKSHDIYNNTKQTVLTRCKTALI